MTRREYSLSAVCDWRLASVGPLTDYSVMRALVIHSTHSTGQLVRQPGQNSVPENIIMSDYTMKLSPHLYRSSVGTGH